MDSVSYLRVAFYPTGMENWENPFWKILKTELKVMGVDIIDVPLTFSSIIRNRRSFKIWNFHYYEWGRYERYIFLAKVFFIKLCGYKIVYTVHNIVPREGKRASTILFLNSLFLIMLADYVIWLGRVPKLFRWKKNKAIIPHFHYQGYYQNQVSREQARERIGIHFDDYVYLFIGLIQPYKGLEELITAFIKLNVQQENYLIIAGKSWHPEYVNKLMKMIMADSHIVFLDRFIPDNELQYLYNSSDVCIFPYKSIENSGSVLLAFSFGKPVIVPKLGNMTMLVPSTKGIAYDNKNVPLSLEAAMRAVKHNSYAKEIGSYLENIPSPGESARRYKDAYERCLTL